MEIVILLNANDVMLGGYEEVGHIGAWHGMKMVLRFLGHELMVPTGFTHLPSFFCFS